MGKAGSSHLPGATEPDCASGPGPLPKTVYQAGPQSRAISGGGWFFGSVASPRKARPSWCAQASRAPKSDHFFCLSQQPRRPRRRPKVCAQHASKGPFPTFHVALNVAPGPHETVAQAVPRSHSHCLCFAGLAAAQMPRRRVAAELCRNGGSLSGCIGAALLGFTPAFTRRFASRLVAGHQTLA